jgi:hypothetical protein
MDRNRLPKRVMYERLYSTKRRGRPKQRWNDDVMKDLKKLNIIGWKEKAKNKVMWRQLVEEAKAHMGLYSQVFSSVQEWNVYSNLECKLLQMCSL